MSGKNAGRRSGGCITSSAGTCHRSRAPWSWIARPFGEACARGAWQPYRRDPVAETLLATHTDCLRERAAAVQYSARILFQELRTIVIITAATRPLSASLRCGANYRPAQSSHGPASRHPQVSRARSIGPSPRCRFGTAGARCISSCSPRGYSRRAFYSAAADQRLSQRLDAHERAFEQFGDHTREHLYDRPRTICYPNGEDRVVWNPTFKAFAGYLGREPRLCRPYRAQSKGKVESGVKHVKGDFPPAVRS